MKHRDSLSPAPQSDRFALVSMALLALVVAALTIALGWHRMPFFALWCAGWTSVWLWLLPSD